MIRSLVPLIKPTSSLLTSPIRISVRCASLGRSLNRTVPLFKTVNKSSCLSQQIRTLSKTTVLLQIDVDKASNLKWDVAEEFPSDPVMTSPIIKFGDLNFLQEILYPYSYCLMHYMDFLISYMPWWSTIILTTVTFRALFFPLYVEQHKIGIRSYNILPQTQAIQVKINEALCSGDTIEAAIARSKMMAVEKQNGLSLWRKLTPALIQAPMFISMFFLLRRYAEQPIQGFIQGGDFWFTNLTVADPYYILPAITSLSTLLLFELGAEGMMTPSTSMTPALRWVLRIFPCVLFYITSSFPAAIVLFWTTNNSITLLQSIVIRNKWISKKLGVPIRLNHDPKSLPLSGQSFMSQWKTAKDTASAKNTTFDVRRLDDLAFRKAGIGPIKKTYKEPPKLNNNLNK